jgi:hypothetical protein
MSTVLWSNLLEDGIVHSDESDKPALHKHAEKLAAISQQLGSTSFLEICDTTDVLFNTGAIELPTGMETSNELMAIEGVWLQVGEAEKLLTSLLAHIQQQNIRFGLLSNDHNLVVAELTAALAYVKSAKSPAAKFNFSIVT